jgi:hypothetical protein
MVAFRRQLPVVQAAKQKVEDARKAGIGAREEARDAGRAGVVQSSKNQPSAPGLLAPPKPPPAAGTLAAAERELQLAQAELKRLYDARVSAMNSIMPSLAKCKTTIRGRCLTWSASLSIGNGAFADIIAMIVRTAAAP